MRQIYQQVIKILKNGHNQFSYATAQSNINQQPKMLKRFYKLATVESQKNPEYPSHLWQIKLDGKNVRTPSKNLLAVPTPMLAHLIANEFNIQKDIIRPPTMPLLQMARSAIDSNKDERLREYLESSLINFLENDTLLFREPPEKKLYQIQTEKLDPILKYFNQRIGMNLQINTGFDVKKLSSEDRSKIQKISDELNSWQLISLQTQAENLKSFILAFLLKDEIIDIKKAVELSRLEEQYSIDIFGLVEGHHDVDENNVMVNTSAAQLFAQMIIQQTIIF